MIKLSIVTVSYNTKNVTLDCLNSLVKNTMGISYEIIVVDNGSIDGSVAAFRNFNIHGSQNNFKIIESKYNLGFAGANNMGIKAAKGEYILLLNSDTIVNGKFLPDIISWMDSNPTVGIASCSLINKDGSIQGTGGYFPKLIRVLSWMTIQDLPFVDRLIKPYHPMRTLSPFKGESFYLNEMELDWVTGAFFLIRREVIDKIGLFDESYFMYVEEVDYCYRAKKTGWKVYYLPRWSITHLGGASGKVWSHVIPEFQGIKRFYKKYYPKWQYPLLRLFLKIGSLGRVAVLGLLKGKEVAKIYIKAFSYA